MRIAVAVTMVAGALTLASCGGGGDTSSPAPVAQQASTITINNAQDAASQGFSSSSSLNSQTSSSSTLVTGVQVETQDIRPGLLDASFGLLYQGLDASKASNLVTGAVVNDSFTCSGGSGTISVKSNTAVSSKISNGDSLTISASNCLSGGSTLNGSIEFQFANVTGTIGSTTAWSATMMLRFSDLSTSTSAGNSSSVNGDMRMDFNQTAYKKATIVVSGNLMQSKVYRYGVLTRNEQLAAYTYTGSIDGNVSTFSSNFSFTGNVAKLGNGTYVIKTVTPFQVTVPALNPSTGVMTVTATDNTSVRLTAIDATSVKLDVDRNGDGVYDETINTTWTDINSRS